MHAVDRGPEPPGLKPIRKRLTPRWVAYYRDGKGRKPTDSKWRDFHENVSKVFCSLCAYCEDNCKGDVEHFRPKSKFPEKVYEWTNWVLACPTCNTKKGRRWPTGGYVDPCAQALSAQPESHFDFDTKTGEIIVQTGQTIARRRKADKTITDLGLNTYHHLKARIGWLHLVSKALQGRTADDPANKEIVRLVASRESRLSSITRTYLDEQGYTYDEG